MEEPKGEKLSLACLVCDVSDNRYSIGQRLFLSFPLPRSLRFALSLILFFSFFLALSLCLVFFTALVVRRCRKSAFLSTLRERERRSRVCHESHIS